jgi:hypothetical protein
VPGRVVGGAIVVEGTVVLALEPATPAPVITVAAVTAVLLSLVLLARSRRTRPIAASPVPGART